VTWATDAADEARQDRWMARTLDPVLPRRTARVAFGAVLIAGVPLLLAHAESPWDCVCPERRPLEMPLVILVAIWVAALLAGAIAWRLTPGSPGVGRRRATASVVVPAIGLGLILPITLQAPIVVLFGGDLAAWVALTGFLTGHVHLVAIAFVVTRVIRLSRGGEVGGYLLPFLVTVALSLVTCVFTYGVSTILVIATGIPMILVARVLEAMAGREWRDRLELPRATLAGRFA
jgi:hypothetical protein